MATSSKDNGTVASAFVASSSSSPTSLNNDSNNQAKTVVAETESEIPRLMPPSEDSDLPSIKLGETIKFEEWGPSMLNSDGTTRRIENWDTLTEREKEVTWRRISKRNEERRKMLLQQQQQEDESKQQNDDNGNKNE